MWSSCSFCIARSQVHFAMPARAKKMDAAPLVPPHPTLPLLRQAAATCHACDLWKRGTQTVFGEGAPRSRVMLVGEQPGDREDIQGHPFVGPAGRLLDTALERAGIDRATAYVTNVVKHFKWEPRGKRRLHSKPNQAEIAACRPWLDAELEVVRPLVLVCLGATAAQAILGKSFRVSVDHGKLFPSTLPGTPRIMATAHPSAVLRAPDDDARHAAMVQLVADLAGVAAILDAKATRSARSTSA
jgi:DNA polymerase